MKSIKSFCGRGDDLHSLLYESCSIFILVIRFTDRRMNIQISRNQSSRLLIILIYTTVLYIAISFGCYWQQLVEQNYYTKMIKVKNGWKGLWFHPSIWFHSIFYERLWFFQSKLSKQSGVIKYKLKSAT